jgi:hypothetical protein
MEEKDIADYIGSYQNVPLCTTVHVEERGSGMVVYFNSRVDAFYPLIYYCGDTYSFLPPDYDTYLRTMMREYYNYEMCLLEFQRDTKEAVTGLLRRWCAAEERSFFLKEAQ